MLQDHVQDSTAVDEFHDAAATSVDESHDDSVVPGELSLSLEAQRSQNAKLRAELAALQQQQELRALEEEGVVLRKKLQRQKAALSKSSVSAVSPAPAFTDPVSTTESRPHKTLDDLRQDETLQDRVAQRLAQLEVEDDSSSESVDDQDDALDDSKWAARRSAG